MRTRMFLIVIVSVLLSQAQEIKLMQGWTINKNSDDSVLTIEKKYDIKGNLISENEPTIYCAQEYTYDSLNRLVSMNNMCGESSANGETLYKYKGNKKTIVSYCSGYLDSTIIEYDSKQKIIRETKLHNVYDWSYSRCISNYYYDGNVLKSKKKTLIEFEIIDDGTLNGALGDSSILHFITKYTYTDFDSLLTMFEVKCETGDTINYEINSYCSKSNKKIFSKTYYYQNKYEYSWKYDRSNKLVKHIETSIDDYKNSTTVYDYKYDNNGYKVTISHEGSCPYKQEQIYDNNLLKKTVSGDEVTNYYYVFY